MNNALPDLQLKINKTSIKIKYNFIAQDMGDSANVVLLAIGQPNVTFFKFGKIVKNDKLNFPFEVSVEFALQMYQFLCRILRGMNSKFFPVKVKIGIKTVEFVKSPEKILVLSAASSKIHLVTIVKLGVYLRWIQHTKKHHPKNE